MHLAGFADHPFFFNCRRKRRLRPLGIVAGIMLSFSVFTLSISYLVHVFRLDPNIFRVIAVVIITFLGLTMLIPQLGRRLEAVVSKYQAYLGEGMQILEADFCLVFWSDYRWEYYGRLALDQY